MLKPVGIQKSPSEIADGDFLYEGLFIQDLHDLRTCYEYSALLFPLFAI